MTATGPQIASLLEKMMSVDKDFRFMATNDLMVELQKDSIKLDDDIERRITKSLLKLLDDKNGEVQNLAVKCLAPLIAKAKSQQIELVVESLCLNIDSEQDRLRDVSSIALKTVVNELSLAQHGKQINLIIRKILPKLLHSLKEEKRADSSIKIEIADILGIVISKFGRQADIDFSEVEDVLFLLIKRERQALRKRAITVLGYFVGTVQDDVYERIVSRVLAGLKDEKDSNALRAYVLAAATISKSSTRLFVEHLQEFIQLLASFCKSTDDDELKDACLHAFEMFIIRCNKEITPLLTPIIEICSELIKHDPNYAYEEDDNEENGDKMEVDSQEGSDDDVDEYSDDDDLSWKVRRSAAKCIEALVTNKSDRLLEHYDLLAPLLLGRFKEREESVKIDVFRAYESLLKQTRLFLPESLSHLDSALFNAAFNAEGDKGVTFSNENLHKIFAEDIDDYQRSILEALSTQVPQVVRAICKQLKSKSPTVRLQCFTLLTALVRALPGALHEHFESLMPAIKSSIFEKSTDSAMKIDTLNFLNLCFCSHEPSVFYSHLDNLIPLIANCANEPFYKVGSVALTVLQSLIIVLKPLSESSSASSKHIEQIYEVIIGKLRLNDIDQEVKERAIATAGILLSTFGLKVANRSNEILPILIDRLRNEMTRQITVQSFCVIVASGNQVNLSPIMNELLVQLSEFLRKNHRALRVSTLTLLSSLVTKYKLSAVPVDGIERVIREIPTIIVEQDLFISQLSLKLAKEVVLNYPQAIASSLDSTIGACVTLVKSGVLVGRLLEFAVDLFAAIVQSSISQKPDFNALMTDLTAPIYTEKSSRQVCHSVAIMMAHSAKANSDSGTTTKLLQNLVDLLKKSAKSEGCQMFALYALGEIGRVYPTAFDGMRINVETVIIDYFNVSNEEVKTVASYSLGALAAGNVTKYLPILLKQIKTQVKLQYLLLHALKEVIASQNSETGISDVFRGVMDEIWTVLLSHSKAPEESIRNIVAECIGKLCKIEPTKFLPALVDLSKKGDSLVRGCCATAVRFMIVDTPNSIADQYVHENLSQLLSSIDDKDLSVKRTTIMSLSSASHNKPRWAKELLPQLLPSLYRETAVNKELIHEVEMGPFKHIVDDGLDLRKSAYECLYSLMEHCLDRIDVLEFMNYIELGLKDTHDIILLNLLMLTRLGKSCSTQMAQRIDGFAELIMPLLQQKARPNSVKQESDKLDESKRACIRTILSLKRIPALDRSSKLTAVHDYIQAETALQTMIKDVIADV